MTSYPNELKYSKEHEWIKINGNEVVIGITDYAAEQLGDIVFVELPELDTQFNKGESFGVVESVKSVSDVYSPISGKVLEVNSGLEDNPALVNDDPYGEGWIAKFHIENTNEVEELLTSEGYSQFLSEEA